MLKSMNFSTFWIWTIWRQHFQSCSIVTIMVLETSGASTLIPMALPSSVWQKPMSTCLCVDDLFTSQLSLIPGSIQVANGSEGRRRHAMYSQCFTPTAIRQYFGAYNTVIVCFSISSYLFIGVFCWCCPLAVVKIDQLHLLAWCRKRPLRLGIV